MSTSERENLVVEFLRTPRYRQLAYGFLHSYDDVDDAMQNTAIIALTKLKLDHPAPWAWFGLVLKNECYSILRKRKHWEHNPTPKDLPADHVDRAELMTARESFQTLKTAEKTALSEFASGYSYKEIAERQGWTRTKVNRCLAEGSKALRNLVTLEA